MKILALDFDGVICNSRIEVLRVAMEAYARLYPESGIPSTGDLSLIERGFENLLPLGNRAEDFGVSLRALERGLRITNQEEYDRFFARQDESWRERYAREFYEVRSRLRSEDPEAWLAMHRPYAEVLRYLEDLEGVALAIVTAKDEASIRLLLAHFGISGLFERGLIFDKSLGPEKTAHLEKLKERLGGRFEDMTFIDDKVRHLAAVSRLGIDVALATWGYNTEREHEIARSRGYRLARLDRPSSILERN